MLEYLKDIHYIELQKDFSNIEDVMKKVNDDDFLQNMANRAYKDIVKSRKYSYKEFVNIFDNEIQSLFPYKPLKSYPWDCLDRNKYLFNLKLFKMIYMI